MTRYLTAAFFSRPAIPGLGNVPVHPVAAAAVLILGFVFPPIWFLGAGLIGLSVFALTLSPRFRTAIDRYKFALDHSQPTAESEAPLTPEAEMAEARAEQQVMLNALKPVHNQRAAALASKAAKILRMHAESNAEPFVMQSNHDALERLGLMHLKLLTAHQALEDYDGTSADDLKGQITATKRELESPKLAPSLRESRHGMLDLLDRRLANVERRQQSLEEIESDLRRVETQVDLALDDAALRGKPAAISTNIELASQLLGNDPYGAVSVASALDTYGSAMPLTPPPLPPQAQRH